MIIAVAPCLGGRFLIAVVAECQSRNALLLQLDADLAGLTDCRRCSVGEQNLHIVLRIRSAHAARLRLHADNIRNGKRGLRLAEALHELDAGRTLELVEDLRIQRLTCDTGVFQRGKIISAEILLDEETVHGRRRAEARDVVFLEHRQNVICMEAVEIIHKYGGFAHPLTVELAPERLAPAGVGDREMQTVRIGILPVTGGHIVAERILIAVQHELRIAGGAGAEEDQHRIGAAGRILAAIVMRAVCRKLCVEIMPALALSVDHDLCFQRRTVCLCEIDLIRDIAVRRADDRRDLRGIEPVFKVMLFQHIRCRDDERADAVQRDDREPELIMPLQYQHDAVAALDAERLEIIRGLAGIALDILECEAALLFVDIDINHRGLVRTFFRHCIHDIECEVEFILLAEMYGGKDALLICLADNEFLRDRMQQTGLVNICCMMLRNVLMILRETGRAARRHDKCIDFAVLAAERDLIVRHGAVVIDTVALMQDLGVRTDDHPQRALEHNIHFLTGMACEMQRLGKCFLGVRDHDMERLDRLVLEFRSKAVVDKALSADDRVALTLSGNGVALQLRAAALHEIRDLNMKRIRTFINKGEAEILFTCFKRLVILDRIVCIGCHFFDRNAEILAETRNTFSDLFDFQFGLLQLFLIVHDNPPL